MRFLGISKVGRVIGGVAIAAMVCGCAVTVRHPRPPIKGKVVGVDPTVSWSPVTTDCTGEPLAAPVAGYNVYAVPGTSVPTVTTDPSELPCGAQTLVDHTKVTPLNGSTLISTAACTGNPAVCTYATSLGTGVYTVAVEAVNADGTVSPVSNTVTVTVVLRPGAASHVAVGK
jgi:hypothetical protein